MASKPRTMSAYMIFANANRDAVREELLSSGSKVSVAEVAKELGRRWKALSEEQQAQWKQQALQRKEEAQQAAAQADEGGEEAAGEPAAEHVALPISVVRKIMLLDPDVKRIQPEAVAMVAHAAEMFICKAAEQATKVAASNKRRTVKLDDVAVLLNKDKRWTDMGMRSLMTSIASEAAGKAAAKSNKVTAPKALPAGMQQITAFLKA